MKIFRLGRAASVAAACIAAATLSASPSSANTGGISFSLVGYEVNDHVIRSGGCRNVPVAATHNAPPQVDDVTASVEVWKGSKYVDTVTLMDDGPGRLSGNFYYCPFKGVGTFRLGPAEVDWTNCCSTDDFLSGTFTSSASASFAAMQASTMSRPTWSKKRGVATITGKGRYFSVDDSQWRRDPKGMRSSLQRRSSSNSPWKTIKRGKSDKRGKVAFKVRAKKRMQYRIVSSQTRVSFSGTSSVITRR